MSNLDLKETLAEMIVSMTLSSEQLLNIAATLKETCSCYLQVEHRLRCYDRINGFEELVRNGQKE